MPVVVKGKSGHLVCERCGGSSATYPSRSAAKELDICEAAHKNEGWIFSMGPMAMMFGHRVYCSSRCFYGKARKLKRVVR
jgi:ribosomal protein L37E